MKVINIFQENSIPILLEDNDDSDIKKYTKTLSEVLDNNNISLLHTSSGSIIIRPNKITAIFVSDIEVEPEENKSEQKKVKSVEKSEDTITD